MARRGSNDNSWMQLLQLPIQMGQLEQQQQQAQQAMAQFQQEQALKQQQLGLEQKKAMFDRAYKIKMINQGVPVYTFGAEGTPQQVGVVPKGSKVVPPAQMETSAQKAESAIATQKGKDIESQNVKREIYSKDLTTFLSVDDVLQQARGQGLGRLTAGGKMTWEGFKQDSPLGQAVASHEAARKRLRVQLVRAAGDVGNINIVEQKAAEMMIPTQWDAADTAKLKRAYLEQIGQAINSNDGNAVKDVLAKFMATPVWKSNLVTIKSGGKTYTIPKDEVDAFKKDKGIK